MLPKEKCTGCKSCVLSCPRGCISYEANREGFFYPVIDEKKCINCKKCEAVCPVLQYTAPETADDSVKAFAAYSKDESIRGESSSGGVFTAIAEAVIGQSGHVYGAAFDESLTVHHICVDSITGLKKLRGSKYVQSNIGNTYVDAEKRLKNGELVLFSGTPCQIMGLLYYLGKEYENLFTVDIICHGVPSDLAWKRYLDYKNGRMKAKAVAASFRDKSTGWKQFSMKICYDNGASSCNKLDEDEYLKAFLQNLNLRESCYNCSFKSVKRCSDFTLGDLWGIQDILPEIEDDKGVSAVFVHSEKGMKLLDSISQKLYLKEMDPALLAEHNGAMTCSVYKPPFRDYFYSEIEHTSFRKLTETCINPGLFARVKRKLRKFRG